MRKSILVSVLALIACGDNFSAPDADLSDAPAATILDGEYGIKISPSEFTCYNEPRPATAFYTVADVVPQSPQTFDLRSDLIGTFSEFDRYDIAVNASGQFSDTAISEISFGDSIVVNAKRFLQGTLSGNDLVADHRYEVGWELPDGEYYTACVYSANLAGTLRYAPWNTQPRDNIDGQWRVKKTILASPLFDPTDLPYSHFIAMDVLAQASDETVFDIQEVRGSVNNHLRYVNRDPVTGAVDATILVIAPGPPITTYETKLWGTLLPDAMDLEFSYRWIIDGEEHFFKHEHYEGVPRYNQFVASSDTSPEGAYNAEYQLLDNNCAISPYTEHRLLDVLATENGISLRITTLGIEPETQLSANGSLTITFTRRTSNKTYVYTVAGLLDGQTINLTMAIVETDLAGNYICTAPYKITGHKRYESYQ